MKRRLRESSIGDSDQSRGIDCPASDSRRRASMSPLVVGAAAAIVLGLRSPPALGQSGVAYAVKDHGVVKYNLRDGTRTTVFDSLFSDERESDLVVDENGAHAYALTCHADQSDWSTHRDFTISTIDLKTGTTEPFLELSFAEPTFLDLELERSQGHGAQHLLYVLLGGWRAAPEIRAYDLATHALVGTTSLTALGAPTQIWGFTINHAGSAFYLNTTSGVYRYDIASASPTLTSAQAANPTVAYFGGYPDDFRQPIALNSSESTIFATSGEAIEELDPSTGVVMNEDYVLGGSFFYGFFPWALSPDDHTILIESPYGELKFDAQTRVLDYASIHLHNATAISFGSDPNTVYGLRAVLWTFPGDADHDSVAAIASDDLSTSTLDVIRSADSVSQLEVDASNSVAYLMTEKEIVGLDLATTATSPIAAIDPRRGSVDFALTADRQGLLRLTQTIASLGEPPDTYRLTLLDLANGQETLLGYGSPGVFNVYPNPITSAGGLLAEPMGASAYFSVGRELRQFNFSTHADTVRLTLPDDVSRLNGSFSSSISPDGSEIAFVGHQDIWTFSLINGPSSQFTIPDLADSEVEYSSDGRNIVYSSSVAGSLMGAPYFEHYWTALDLSSGTTSSLSPLRTGGSVGGFALLDTADGANVEVMPVDSTTGTSPATVTFQQVDVAGDTTLTTSTSGPDVPSGFQLLGTYYDLHTTATLGGPAEVCIHYEEDPAWADTPIDEEATLQLLHYENNKWVDITTTRDPVNNVICGVTKSFSPFAVVSFPAMGLLADLVNRVQNLDLKHGIEASLDAKLAAAQAALDEMIAGRHGDAITALGAFINECLAQRDKAIPAETADQLIADANRIIDSLR
jgi:hypothetical protein